MTRIRPGASPCSGTSGDRPRHTCSKEHAEQVEGYRVWRSAWEREHEEVALGYAAEQDDHRRERPAPTFRDYLTKR